MFELLVMSCHIEFTDSSKICPKISIIKIQNVYLIASQSHCPNEITLTATEDEKVYPDKSDNVYPLAVIGFLGVFVLVLTITAGIQFRR